MTAHRPGSRWTDRPLHACVGHVLDAGTGTGTGMDPGQRVLAVPDNECGLADVYRACCDATHPLSPDRLTDAQATLVQPLATDLRTMAKLDGIIIARVTVLSLGPVGFPRAQVLSRRGARITGVGPVRRGEARRGEARTSLSHSASAAATNLSLAARQMITSAGGQ
ncbi:hypothetical protein [Streptomyces sp. NPDC055036]